MVSLDRYSTVIVVYITPPPTVFLKSVKQKKTFLTHLRTLEQGSRALLARLHNNMFSPSSVKYVMFSFTLGNLTVCIIER